jgi:DNA polymerase III delta subunit
MRPLANFEQRRDKSSPKHRAPVFLVSGKEHYQKKGRDVKIDEDSRRCAGGRDCAKSRLAEPEQAWQTLLFFGSFGGQEEDDVIPE